VVTLATGRSFKSAARSAAELEITSPIASFQGAQITDPVTGRVLWHMPLTSAMVRMALDATGSPDLEVMGYSGDAVIGSSMTTWLEAYGKRNDVEVRVVGDLASHGDELTRLVVRGADDVIERLEADLKARFDSALYVTRSLPYFCEILHPRSGKDKALAWLAESLGVDRRDTIAFGNGYNDVQMLEWSGLAVAIGGAVPQALAVADVVAPPLEEDGAARILEELMDEDLIG
jgi:Cof subfamily protein (haloacid dehalogenase superfamily)